MNQSNYAIMGLPLKIRLYKVFIVFLLFSSESKAQFSDQEFYTGSHNFFPIGKYSDYAGFNLGVYFEAVDGADDLDIIQFYDITRIGFFIASPVNWDGVKFSGYFMPFSLGVQIKVKSYFAGVGYGPELLFAKQSTPSSNSETKIYCSTVLMPRFGLVIGKVRATAQYNFSTIHDWLTSASLTSNIGYSNGRLKHLPLSSISLFLTYNFKK